MASDNVVPRVFLIEIMLSQAVLNYTGQWYDFHKSGFSLRITKPKYTAKQCINIYDGFILCNSCNIIVLARSISL